VRVITPFRVIFENYCLRHSISGHAQDTGIEDSAQEFAGQIAPGTKMKAIAIAEGTCFTGLIGGEHYPECDDRIGIADLVISKELVSRRQFGNVIAFPCESLPCLIFLPLDAGKMLLE
jgi:hypothetical protein